MLSDYARDFQYALLGGTEFLELKLQHLLQGLRNAQVNCLEILTELPLACYLGD